MRLMKNWLVLCTFGLAATFAMSACKKPPPPPEEEVSAAESASSEAESDAPSPADAAEQAKLSAAIECVNRHSNRVFEVRRRYLDSVDPKTGKPPRGGKALLLGLYGPDACSDQVKKAGELKPSVAELDAASAAYVAALEALVAVHKQLENYYEKGEHLDDSGKKAMEIHPKLVAAFTAFEEAHDKLSSQVRTRNRARRTADLAAREKSEGRTLEVIIDNMMLEAETLVSMATAETIDGAPLDAEIAAYGKLVDEVDAYADAHPDEASKRGSITNVRNYQKRFLAASKVVARKVSAKKKPTGDERSEVTKQYNSLVDNYNSH